MKARILAYGAYLILSIIISLIVAAVPALFLLAWAFWNIDSILNGLGWPFIDIQSAFQGTFNAGFPTLVYTRFWGIIFLIPVGLFCYALFLGILIGMFKISRRGIPRLEDGYYKQETEDWLLYEFAQVYYILIPYFAGFFSIFLDTSPRHMLFGAKIGKNTVIGNGRMFNPERTVIGENCFFGYDAILSGHVYESGCLYLKKVKLGNNVTVGSNAVILAGADIGDNVLVAATSVVPKDKVVPPNSIWVRGKALPRKPVPCEEAEAYAIGSPTAGATTGEEEAPR
ncbi:MAG: DapH/DapD/GlmU-related protein [Candidatus Thorarchaeota archaeon]